jgi:hypothetical protein
MTKHIRAARRNRTVRNGRFRSTVTVPVPLRLCSTNQTDGRRDGHHPSNTVHSTAVNGIRRHWTGTSEKLYFCEQKNTRWPYHHHLHDAATSRHASCPHHFGNRLLRPEPHGCKCATSHVLTPSTNLKVARIARNSNIVSFFFLRLFFI